MLEVDRIERLDQRQVEHGEIDRRLVPDVAMVVPSIERGEHHVARAEGDVLAFDVREITLAGEAEADRVRGMAVRRHHLVRVIEPVGRVHRAHGRTPRREPGID